MTYIKGNFAESIKYAKNFAKNPGIYNLFSRNCTQIATRVLRKGVFAGSSARNKRIQANLSVIEKDSIPNKSKKEISLLFK